MATGKSPFRRLPSYRTIRSRDQAIRTSFSLMSRPLNQSGTVVGLKPWYPWPLSRWPWWTAPVAAERLAALRIGLASVLLLDVLLTYLPMGSIFFGKNSFGSPAIFRNHFTFPSWEWSLFLDVESPWVIQASLLIW